MAKFKIATPAGASFTVAGGGYDLEMETLRVRRRDRRGPTDEDGFINFAQDADAIYAKGMRFTKKMVDGLPERCRTHRAGQRRRGQRRCGGRTARGIPVTNCPDTFIEEVADHAMMLLLSTRRRVIEQDRMVREGVARGPAGAAEIPRLMGQTLGLIPFGHVARAVAERAKGFGLRIMAYDPFIEELVMPQYGVLPAIVLGGADAVRLRFDARSRDAERAEGS